MASVGALLWVISLPGWLGATDYQEHWQATGFRTASASQVSGAGGTTGQYCLGPSAWQVDGSVGGVTFQETWTGGPWINSWPVYYPDLGGAQPVRRVAYSLSSNCQDDETLDSVASDTRITTIGLYGGMTSIRNGNGLDDWYFESDIFGVRSMPQSWHIQGTTR